MPKSAIVNKDLFRTRLVALRNERDMSQRSLASVLTAMRQEQTSISTSTVNAWESGNRLPTITNLKLIAQYFNVSINYLAGVTPHRKLFNSDEQLTIINSDQDYTPLKKSDLRQYDQSPVLCVFPRSTHSPKWGLYDAAADRVVFIHSVINEVQSKMRGALELYTLKDYAEHMLKSPPDGFKSVHYDDILKGNFTRLYVKFNTLDENISDQYDGYYTVSSNKLSLLNSTGNALMTEWVDTRYFAFAAAGNFTAQGSAKPAGAAPTGAKAAGTIPSEVPTRPAAGAKPKASFSTQKKGDLNSI